MRIIPLILQAVLSLEGGSFGTEYSSVPQVGFRVGTRAVGVVGAEGAIAIAGDRDWQVLVNDISVSFPAGDNRVFVTPRFGASLLAGGGGALGVHAGIGIVARVRHRLGVRADFTYRRILLPPFEVSLASLTVGIALLR